MKTLNNYGFVYEWMNIINEMKYLGSHEGLENDGYIGSGIRFRRAIKKYGKDNFIRKIIYRGENCKIIEDIELKKVNAANNPSYYNLKNEAVGGSFPGEKNGMHGKHLSEESKQKMSKTAIANYTEERKIKHSNDMLGEKNPMYGKKYHTHGLIKRAKSQSGKTYEEIHGEEKAKQIKLKFSNERKGKKHKLKIVICPHCNLQGSGGNMTRYHFDKCRKK